MNTTKMRKNRPLELPKAHLIEITDTYRFVPTEHINMLNVIPVYNEIKLLPLHLRWCEANGIGLYVVDNYSKDGTLEWLKENKARLVGFHQVNTHETFDLRIIQKSLMQVVHDYKPTWFIYSSADLFYMTDKRLYAYLTDIKNDGYNACSFPVINLVNTGEVYGKYDPLNTYFYCSINAPVTLIAMYSSEMTLFGDALLIPDMKAIRAPGAVFNFGFTKSVAERNETLERRQRAWKNGMRAQHGRHYLKSKARNWIWMKEEATDIRESKYAKYYEWLKEQVEE